MRRERSRAGQIISQNMNTQNQQETAALAPVAGSTKTPRETRQWWAVHEGSVLHVTGYTCAPNNPGMWWCPQIGNSCSEGHHLFATEAEAIDKMISELERLAEETQERLTAFRLRRSNTQAEARAAQPANHA
jgi:hypothetical protein